MTNVGEPVSPDAGEPARARFGTGPPAPRARIVASCLAILSVATAVIHFAVAGEHFAEFWLFGVFMLVVAWLQLTWAIVALVRASRWLLVSGIILNAGVVVVYIITRTVGDVVGPTPHAVEPFGFGDGLCTVLEAVIVAGCAWLLTARGARVDRRVSRNQLITVPAATGTVTAVLLSVALVAGGPDMVMTTGSSAAAGTTPSMTMPGTGTGTPAIRLATSSPAGDITMPDTNMMMAPGMKMASAAPCHTAPTADQQKAAVSMVDTSWQDARKYQSLTAAKAAGYVPVTPAGAPVVHYISAAAYRATLLGGPVLDYQAPQSLVYANTPSGAVLAAAMYITAPGGATPQPGGCLTQWHVHTNLCLARGLGVVAAVGAAHPACPAGSRNRVTPPMIHVWFVPIPGGPTAIDASSAQVVHAAEQVTSPANGPA
jgi:hypothetical protein